jgi:tRNA(Phe) wybutosine-synthesizing methylase Tyw3
MRCTLRPLRKAVAGVEESKFFTSMRKQILSDLQENKNDKSLAGRVDPQIAALVDYVNTSFPQYVTSSSCAGRVSLFHKGIKEKGVFASPRLSVADAASDAATSSASTTPADVALIERRKRGSFGQGALYQSHDRLPDDTCGIVAESVVPALERFWMWRKAQASDATLYASEVLQLKFEPMILHVLCIDLEAAAELLKCGSESGQMSSGIVSCSRGTKAHRKITCCITSPLCVDIPLFAHDSWCLPCDDFHSATWTTFLNATLHHINALFDENVRRRERFMTELRIRLHKRES